MLGPERSYLIPFEMVIVLLERREDPSLRDAIMISMSCGFSGFASAVLLIIERKGKESEETKETRALLHSELLHF